MWSSQHSGLASPSPNRHARPCVNLRLNFVQFLCRKHTWRMASRWQWCAMRTKLTDDPFNHTLLWHCTLPILVRIPLFHGFVQWHPKIMFDHEHASFCTQRKTDYHNIQQKTASQLFHQRCNHILNTSFTLPLIQLCQWNHCTWSAAVYAHVVLLGCMFNGTNCT